MPKAQGWRRAPLVSTKWPGKREPAQIDAKCRQDQRHEMTSYVVVLLSTQELLILRSPPSLTNPYAVRSVTTRPSLK